MKVRVEQHQSIGQDSLIRHRGVTLAYKLRKLEFILRPIFTENKTFIALSLNVNKMSDSIGCRLARNSKILLHLCGFEQRVQCLAGNSSKFQTHQLEH